MPAAKTKIAPGKTTDVAAEPSYRSVILGLAVLLLLQVAGVAVWQKWFTHESPIPAGDSQDVIARMQEDVRERRYDDAVQVGLSSLKNLPSDDVVLQQIGIVYLRRAQIEGQPERWVAQAAEYTEKALSVNPGDQVNLYSSARALEIAGDFSAARRCAYYARSATLLEQRLPLLTGDHLMMNGQPAAAEPLRQENDSLLTRVRTKIKKNGCP
jgi:hypothetical protein